MITQTELFQWRNNEEAYDPYADIVYFPSWRVRLALLRLKNESDIRGAINDWIAQIDRQDTVMQAAWVFESQRTHRAEMDKLRAQIVALQTAAEVEKR